jgi:NADH-quinone oxidoreductase subunit E
VYVCTNISCSLCGADALLAAMQQAAGEAPDGEAEFNVRAFECLGACDIAPMASVDGVYVGPLSVEDVPALLDDVRAGRPVLAEKQLARKRVADPHANSQEWAGGNRSSAESTARAGAAMPERTPEQEGA